MSTITEANKYVARTLVKYAIRRGELMRPENCEDCGIECKPQAHHDDYDEPLQVRWLCTTCHTDVHHPAETDLIVKRAAEIARASLIHLCAQPVDN